MKNNVHVKPRIEVLIIDPPRPQQRVKFTGTLSFKLILLGIFLAGGISGAALMAKEQVSQATDTETAVASSPTTTESWSKPLEYDDSQLDVVTDLLPVLIAEARHEPTPEELANAQRKEALRQYFIGRKSPFADSEETLDAFLNAKNMNLMIAISFVESTMGQRCYYKNCSGIGGYPPNLRKYESHAEWVKDFDALLERRYKGLPIEKFMGLYVQPGSPNWINGVKQILAELKKANIE